MMNTAHRHHHCERDDVSEHDNVMFVLILRSIHFSAQLSECMTESACAHLTTVEMALSHCRYAFSSCARNSATSTATNSLLTYHRHDHDEQTASPLAALRHHNNDNDNYNSNMSTETSQLCRHHRYHHRDHDDASSCAHIIMTNPHHSSSYITHHCHHHHHDTSHTP